MEYRKIGKWGLKLSELSLGSWVTFGKQVDTSIATELMAMAYDHGVNFFDNAEVYALGQSESIMGEALRKLGWERENYVISSKFYWGITKKINHTNTLNRKYLLNSINGSLKRLGLDFVDITYCHRPDPETPIEETVHAMHDIITSGKALYWGTSEWDAPRIIEAYRYAEKHGLHKPIVEQPQYSILVRKRFEEEYAYVFKELGIGSTIWSPLAAGLLTGKYTSLTPSAGTRFAMEGFEWLKDRHLTEQNLKVVNALKEIANEIDTTLPKLAIAWCLKNNNVSSVILGATKKEQLIENLAAIEVKEKLTTEVMQKITEVTTPNN